MQSKQIVIEINQNGDASIDGQGFSGIECKKFLGEIEQSLGISVKRCQKPEYRQTRRVRRVERNMG